MVGEGAEASTFYVHENLASRHSEFFAAAMRKGWKEAEQRLIRLPEDSSESFEVFARFLYSRKLYTHNESDSPDSEDEWFRLERCWVLGDKLGSITFKDAILDAMREKLWDGDATSTSSYESMYPVSTAGSPVRRLLVDFAAYRWDLSDIEGTKMRDNFNEFFRNLAIAMYKKQEEVKNDDAAVSRLRFPDCHYHEHVKSGSTCYVDLF